MQSRDITTVGDAARALARRRSPRVLGAVLAAEVAVRARLGPPTWRDAAAAGALAAVYPFGEWAIHVHLLHLPPFRVRGRRVELPTAAAHRAHHEQPNDLDMVLLAPAEAAALTLVAVPLVVLAGAGLAAAVTPGHVTAGPLVTAAATGTALVGVYEWTHFLIHTAHRPRSRLYRAIWRGHRLHHFKNERYWHGITSTLADHAFGTAPDQRSVPRSPTARTLRAD